MKTGISIRAMPTWEDPALFDEAREIKAAEFQGLLPVDPDCRVQASCTLQISGCLADDQGQIA